MYIRAIPFAGTFDMYGLIYRVPDHLQLDIQAFQFVLIPLKNQDELALVGQILTEIPSLDASKIRDISSIVHQGIFFSSEQLLLLEWISHSYIVPIHSVLQLFFPKNMREKLLKQTYDKVVGNQKNYQLDFSLELSPAQSKALCEIESTIFPLTLLYGITGSGKTHLYIELTKRHLEKGESVLILVPEIVLTSQVAGVFAQYFGDDILIITSDLAEAERTKYWKTLHTGKARLVIGTRSALYYPHQNLGLIIMDEEHDESYNSDKSPRYQTRKVLETWANISGVPVLLGSGTPSIEMMYRALRGEIALVHLLEKYQENRD